MEINEVEKLNRLTFGTVSGSNEQTLPGLADLHLDSDDESSQDTDSSAKPKFNHRSRIFELDPCDGYSKVCLVYHGTKLGVTGQSADIWLLDRALRWHYMAPTFVNYYCQMMIHVGLPQWQLTFTDIGLLPQAKQWFNLYCPTRSNDGHVDEVTRSIDSAQQLDVAKVFKGKIDKKKPIGSQVIKKKFPPTLPPKPGSGKASTSNISGNKPGAVR